MKRSEIVRRHAVRFTLEDVGAFMEKMTQEVAGHSASAARFRMNKMRMFPLAKSK
jgi:hypothetical protein